MAYLFDYPTVFTSLPDYTAHAGQLVDVVRPLRRDEYDFEGEAMFLVRAADGWEGQAWRSELRRVTASLNQVIGWIAKNEGCGPDAHSDEMSDRASVRLAAAVFGVEPDYIARKAQAKRDQIGLG